MYGFLEKNLKIQFIKLRIVLFPILFIVFSGFSQELLPLKKEVELFNIKLKPKNPDKNTEDFDTLSLPFIDDFSTSDIIVNNTLFDDSGGVYINNRFCINPPTFQVATFDGLDYKGEPYSETNQFSRGKCDTLISNPIDLNNKNDVFISFWWQAQGNAVPQVATDSFHLLFLDNTNNWNLIWSQTGQAQADFKQEIIKIDSQYLYKGFRFKFESFGNQSGMFGVWHLDYIYIDDDRSATDSVLNDIAYSNTPSSFLKKYWAMPIWQFFENPAQELNDSITSSLNNFKNDGTGFPFIVETNVDLIDNFSSNTVNIHNEPANSIDQSELQKIVTATNNSYSFIQSVSEFTTIQNRFTVVSNDQNIGDTISGEIADFQTTRNDTISSYTTLADYYAYDDGTAEQAFKISTQDGLVMQEFSLNRKDTLYGLSVHFPGNTFDYDSNQIVWMVWDSIQAGDDYDIDHIIYDDRGLISVADSVNKFVFYNFIEPVVVENKFFIGYKQDDDYDVLIGYDINSDPGFEPIYFNTNGTWQKFQQSEGVLMIRPHFRPHLFASVEEEFEELDVNVFPNPATEQVNFSREIEQVEVYNLSGELMIHQEESSNSIRIDELESGMYFVLLKVGDKIKRTKVIKL